MGRDRIECLAMPSCGYGYVVLHLPSTALGEIVGFYVDGVWLGEGTGVGLVLCCVDGVEVW